MFHVSSARNRDSIRAHGLDWTRMGAARGIAGSHSPEVAGVFLARDAFEASLFVRMNNTGGPVDVWSVDDVATDRLVTTGSGYDYLPAVIAADRLRLVPVEEVETWMTPWAEADRGGSGVGYSSTLSVTLDDGTVLTGDEAQESVRRQP